MTFMYRNVNAKEKHCNTPISILIRSEHCTQNKKEKTTIIHNVEFPLQFPDPAYATPTPLSCAANGFDPEAGRYSPAAISSVALHLFKQSLRENPSAEPWNLRWVSICMGQFVAIQDPRHSITSYFSKKRKRVDSTSAVIISDDDDDENDDEIIAAPRGQPDGHTEEPVISGDEDDLIMIMPSAPKWAKTSTGASPSKTPNSSK